MADRFTHGAILCGTVLTPDFAAALADYTRELGFEPVDEGRVSPDLARSWGAPAQVGCPYALLAPSGGGSGGFLRLVGGSAVASHRPLSSYGWAAFELSVEDSFKLHERIDRAAFRVLGAPKLVPGFTNFIPFQVAGRSGEVLYLNTVLESRMAGLDLPKAKAPVDSMFIAVLAAEDRAATVAFHADALGFEEGDSFTIPYSMINESFGLPAHFLTTMTMTKAGRTPASEVDQYPEAALHRPRAPGELPPGNAMVTFAVRSLDAVNARFIEPPAMREGPLYRGARVATVVGPSSERMELVECG
jgi:catechol 2,3-dioxygenase-like lactoylglutathione lyase family enzyme